jgi:hypothetical protein
LAQFDRIAVTSDGDTFDGRPWPGALADAPLNALIEGLHRARATEAACWFAYLCDGEAFGDLVDNLEVLTNRRAWDANTERRAHFRLMEREYVLLSGPVSALQQKPNPPVFRVTPQLWWPEDQRWFVATDQDSEFTLVGADAKIASVLVAQTGLEIYEVAWSDRIDEWGDVVNE